MEIQKTALLGIHDYSKRKCLSDMLAGRGFNVTPANTVNEMLQHMGVNSGQDLMQKNNFGLYLMDLNLGLSGINSYAEAEIVFKYVKPYFDGRQAKFLGISGLSNTVNAARSAGIPAEFTTEKIYEFIGYL